MANPTSGSGPPFSWIYSEPGTGKTIAEGMAAGPGGLYLASTNALGPIKRVLGFDPHFEECHTVEQALTKVRGYGKQKGNNRPHAVIVDDFSVMMETTWGVLDVKLHHNNFKVMPAMKSLAIDFRDACREAGFPIYVSCWSQPPKTLNRANGSKVDLPGGPRLPSDLLVECSGLADVVVRMNWEPRLYGGLRERAFDHSNADYIAKDRGHVAIPGTITPANLRATFVVSGEWNTPFGIPLMDKLAPTAYEMATELFAGIIRTGPFGLPMPGSSSFGSGFPTVTAPVVAAPADATAAPAPVTGFPTAMPAVFPTAPGPAFGGTTQPVSPAGPEFEAYKTLRGMLLQCGLSFEQARWLAVTAWDVATLRQIQEERRTRYSI